VVSTEVVQEERVTCGAVWVLAALLAVPVAMSQVATKVVVVVKAVAIVERVISLAVCKGR
jgi:hypothetical protein